MGNWSSSVLYNSCESLIMTLGKGFKLASDFVKMF